MTALLVMTTLPDSASAVKLATDLVASRCAACVHIMQAGQSVYRWESRIQVDSEITLLIKSTETAFASLQSRILECHPYELPEIIALPVVHGNEPYLAWLADETVAASAPEPASNT